MKKQIIKNKLFFFFLSLFTFSVIFSTNSLFAMEFGNDDDEIVFYNVGEGHCTLARKKGHAPLLLDAGSRQNLHLEISLQEIKHPLATNGRYVIQKLTDKIVSHWGKGPNYNLNVILTHTDDDHTKYLPDILKQLKKEQPFFTCNILLGGQKKDYEEAFLQSLRLYQLVYSSDFLGLFQGERLGFFNSSGCITHLFCPQGRENNPNSWSIITRIELNRGQKFFSALIPGDADHTVQESSLGALGVKLRSDILLYPHHGAQPLLYQWIQAIDPEAVVISAGRFKGTSAHPKAEAIESLFWQGDLPQANLFVNVIEQLGTQMRDLQLDGYNRSERIWNSVDPHKVVYYGNQNNYENIRKKIPTSRYGDFNFIDDTWYTGFGLGVNDGWRCALLDFPIYTLYASGTLAFQFDTPSISRRYKANFVDIPSETDLMVRWITDAVIDDVDDLMSFHLLPHITKREVYELLRRETRNIEEATRLFFLSFVVIPNIESDKNNINVYRERKFLKLLAYFLPRTRGLDFTDPQDMEFFRNIEDTLFADASGYKDIEDISLFKQRKFLFDAFFTGPHLQEKEQRNDLFYLYYVIYSLFDNCRDQMTAIYLQNLIQSFRSLPFRKSLDLPFPQGGVENLLDKTLNIYDICNTNEREYYRLDMEHLGSLVHLLYNQKIQNSDIEILEELLSILPNYFNVPVDTTVAHLITLLPKIRTIQDFKPITNLFRDRLFLNPRAKHLDILSNLLEEM